MFAVPFGHSLSLPNVLSSVVCILCTPLPAKWLTLGDGVVHDSRKMSDLHAEGLGDQPSVKTMLEGERWTHRLRPGRAKALCIGNRMCGNLHGTRLSMNWRLRPHWGSLGPST